MINIIVYKGRNYSSQEEYGTKLITEYTYKHLLEKGFSSEEAKNKTAQLIKSNKDKLFTYHGYAWDLGRKSLEFFCLWFLHNIYVGEDKAELANVQEQLLLK